MPIGKDSITKRVAKPAAETAPATKATTPKKTTAKKEEKIAPELVATTAAAPKKTPAKKSSSTTAKKTAPKKDIVTEKLTPPTALVDTIVIPNISPETVKAVTGHEENKGFEKVQIGQKMPSYLL